MSYELPTTAGMKSLHCKRLTHALILLFKCVVWDLLIVGIDLIYTRSYFERVPSSCPFPTNADKVFSLMNKIRKSKPTGLDRISLRLIRECTDLICVPMCDLFNHSFRQGKLPEDCKSVRVALLFKQDDRDNWREQYTNN